MIEITIASRRVGSRARSPSLLVETLDSRSLDCWTAHMATPAHNTDPMSDDRTVRGSEAEAVEVGANGKRAPRNGAQGGAGGKAQRVRIQRDYADIPAIKDETGEKVAQLFEGFLEQ